MRVRIHINAKIICGIIATISIAVLGFFMLPSLWFWISWEVLAAGLVAVGCASEWYLFLKPSKEGDEAHKLHHRRRELQSVTAVAIGVLMEFLALSHAIPEAIRLEKNVSDANTRVEELRQENDLLEAEIQPRRIKPEQRAVIMTDLRGLQGPKCRVSIVYNQPDLETAAFAIDVWQILSPFFPCEIYDQMVTFPSQGKFPVYPPTGVWLEVHESIPPGAEKIRKALVDSGVIGTNAIIGHDASIEGGLLKIAVWPKPLPEIVRTNALKARK